MDRLQRLAGSPLLPALELKMTDIVTHETLHRGAKYFMDSGRAASHQEALDLLGRFGLYIEVGPDVCESRDHQIALLTLVNCARRTLLGGVHVVGVPRAPLAVPLVGASDLPSAVEELGGRVVSGRRHAWPTAIVGTVRPQVSTGPAWQLTWSGWRAGVMPFAAQHRLDERDCGGLAPVMAAAACAAEAFLFHADDHPMAGRRSSGVSLWNPGANWLVDDTSEPTLRYLPLALWLIGLGNLGQAYLWVLSSLAYRRPHDLMLVLQDDDRLAASNDSTSLLSSLSTVGTMKTRATAAWAERRGFCTSIEERKFGDWMRRAPHEPTVALCGVDNALARQSLERAGFGLVVETGLGAGVQAFKNFSMHTFPSSLNAAALWKPAPRLDVPLPKRPAYDPDKHPGLDACGLHQLASRTIGVPFVGLTAAVAAIAEILRRLHGGGALELLSGSLATLEDLEVLRGASDVFEFGYTHCG